MSRLSWIGLGHIGTVLCRNLANYGPSDGPVVVWNRSHQSASTLASETDRCIAAESIDEAISDRDVICLCLLDDTAVKEVITTVVENNNVTDKLFVDFSTIHPDTATLVSEQLKAHGAEYLACPIFGGVPLARNRQITVVLAGSSGAIEKFTPYTDGVICKSTIVLADQPCGQASSLKLIGNFIRLSAIEVLSEASVLAEKVGLPSEALAKFTDAMMPGAATGQLKMLQDGDYHNPDKPAVPISMAVKEQAHLHDLAQRNGANLRNLDTITSLVQRLEQTRGPNANLLAIFGIIREESGMSFEN